MSAAGGLGGEQVEGRHAVVELLRAGRRRVHGVSVAGRAGQDETLRRLARQAGVALSVVPDAEIARLARSEVPQGVVARAEPLATEPLSSLVSPGSGGPPFLVVLDQVNDPHNLGAILRSAAGAGATGVVLARRRATHLTPSACKAAAGAVEHLRFALVPGIPAALAEVVRAGVWAVGLDAGGSVDLEDVRVLAEPVAIVLGSEGTGLARLTRERCDVLARIPLSGPLQSLNVAAAAAIGCFTVSRHRALPR